ncbi:MAG TPA: hypothetical protein VHY91_16575 [Pirellulales bacterium]|jgi:hypothetical protein|nr:hypothetical protein [Pirellulales bacterium]
MAKEKTVPDGDVSTQSPEDASAAKEAPRKKTVPKARRKKNRRTKSRRRETVQAGHVQEPESGEKGKRSRRPFPQNTLEDALSIPQAIKDKTNGNPCDTELIAKAVSASKQGAKFYYLCASARDYGLTIGSRDTAQIALDDIGRAIVYAPDAVSRRAKQIEAFFKIDKFKKVFEFYGGSSAMPEGEFVSNVLLNQFNLDTSEHDEFIDLFKKNCEFLQIADGLGGVPSPSSGKDKQDSVDITIVGQPRGKFDKTAFVIMPFSEKGAVPRPRGFFDEVLKSLITPAGNAAQFAVETARREGSDVIHHTIINQLIQAELVIADLTDHNPSVLFELGIRIALMKPVCLVKAEGTGPIFDVDNLMRVLPYNPNLWRSTVETDVLKITDHINGAWESKDSGHSYMNILTAPHQAISH